MFSNDRDMKHTVHRIVSVKMQRTWRGDGQAIPERGRKRCCRARALKGKPHLFHLESSDGRKPRLLLVNLLAESFRVFI